MMWTIIPTLLISAFLFYSVESSSHGAGSSGAGSSGAGSSRGGRSRRPIDLTKPQRNLPLGPGEELVVDRRRRLVLGRADFVNKMFSAYKDRGNTEFIEYNVVDLPEYPFGRAYYPVFPHPEQWALDVYNYGVENNNDWIHDRAIALRDEHIDDETARRELEENQQMNAAIDAFQAHADYLIDRNRQRRSGGGGGEQ